MTLEIFQMLKLGIKTLIAKRALNSFFDVHITIAEKHAVLDPNNWRETIHKVV